MEMILVVVLVLIQVMDPIFAGLPNRDDDEDDHEEHDPADRACITKLVVHESFVVKVVS